MLAALLATVLLSGAAAQALCATTPPPGAPTSIDLPGSTKMHRHVDDVQPAPPGDAPATDAPCALIDGPSSPVSLDGAWTAGATSHAAAARGSADAARLTWLDGAATYAASAALFSGAPAANVRAILRGLSNDRGLRPDLPMPVDARKQVLAPGLSRQTGASAAVDARPVVQHRALVLVCGSTSEGRHVPQFALIEKYAVAALASDIDTVVIGVVLCLSTHGAAFLNASRTTEKYRRAVVVNDAFVDQFERLDDCFRQAEATRERSGWGNATHYLRVRPDTVFVRRVAPLGALQPDFVSGRARTLTYAKPTSTKRAKLSAFWQGCGSGKHVRSVSRADMKRAGLKLCASFDDIFAVVPQRFAAAYFLIEPNYPGDPEPGAAVWSDSPYRQLAAPDAAYGAAIRETYGAATHAGVFDRLCHPMAKNKDEPYATAGSRFCCEPRLTRRLMMRLVPYSIEPFRLAISKRAGDQPHPLSMLKGHVDC